MYEEIDKIEGNEDGQEEVVGVVGAASHIQQATP